MTQRKAKLRHALKADANDHNPLLSARRTESCSQKSEMNTQERQVDQKTEDAPIRMKAFSGVPTLKSAPALPDQVPAPAHLDFPSDSAVP
jgi:hypothetical protein